VNASPARGDRRPVRSTLARVIGRALLVLGLAAVLVLVLAGASTSPGGPDEPPAPATLFEDGLVVGVQDDRLPVDTPERVERGLDRLARLGVPVTRVDVHWREIAPARPLDGADPNDPVYRWERWDRVLDGLAARGIHAILNVYRAPDWANGGRGPEWAPDPDEYERFMRALAARYDGRTRDAGGRTHARAGMFEPWNEPNLTHFLRPQWTTGPGGEPLPASPAIYADMLTRAHRAVHAVQPDAMVIGVSGGPVGSDQPPEGGVGILTFIRALALLQPPLDAYAQHLYPGLGPRESRAMPSFTRLDELIAELDRIEPGLPLMVTELGWTTAASAYRSTFVDEGRQAQHLDAAVDALAANPRVRLAIWFNLQDNAGWPAGLLRADESEKPAWARLLATPKRFPLPTPERALTPARARAWIGG